VSVVAGALASPAKAQSLIPGGGWSGPYFGATAGGAFARVKNASSSSDLTWTGHLGYGFNISSLYLGAEVDATWGGATATTALSPLESSKLTLDWSTSARARVGIAGNGILLYVTGGAAWSGQSLAVASVLNGSSTSTKTIPGFVVGAGLEMKLLPYITGRIEALHYDFSSANPNFRVAIPAGFTALTNRGLDETVVRAGISLRFN
jgi:outer membrane immunogenic protein